MVMVGAGIPEEGPLVLEEVMRVTGWSKRTVYDAIARGRFPKPLPEKRDGKRSLWDREAVMSAVTNRTGHVRKFCEERGAAPFVEGCDAALLGFTMADGVPLTVYDHARLVTCLTKRGMANAGKWVLDQSIGGEFVILVQPGVPAPEDDKADADSEDADSEKA